jgi:hypothetical protein
MLLTNTATLTAMSVNKTSATNAMILVRLARVGTSGPGRKATVASPKDEGHEQRATEHANRIEQMIIPSRA